ncbi:MAG: ketosteroid isomerase-like protein [Oceanicoccus sp.]|jgi:ketosteroid isomerase-like protein
MIKRIRIFSFLYLLASHASFSDTNTTLLEMENACIGKPDAAKTATLSTLKAECRPSVNHGGAATPDALAVDKLSTDEQQILAAIIRYTVATKNKDANALAQLITNDFVIIQPGGNAWDKQTYMDVGVAHLMAMFTELSLDIIPVRIFSTENAATVVGSFRLGGLHMGKPATTFGLGSISLVKKNDQWLIQHIHNSGMQVY